MSSPLEAPPVRLRRSRFRASVGGIGVAVLVLAWMMFGRSEAPSFPLPVPNGFDDFLLAAERVRDSSPPSYRANRAPDPAARREWMAVHEEAFVLVRRGLGKECRVPIRVTPGWGRRHQALLESMHHLSWCLIERAEWEAEEGRHRESFEAYVEVWRFAHEQARGGVMIDWICQVSCEARVLKSLESALPRFSARQRRDIAEMLDRGLSDWEEPEAVLARDRDLGRAFGGADAPWRVGLWDLGNRVRRSLDDRSLAPLAMSRRWRLENLRATHLRRVRSVCDQLRKEPSPAEEAGAAEPGGALRRD